MANVQTTITEIRFQFLEDKTNVYVYYKSTEPDNPFWGGQDVKFKVFDKAIPTQDILPEIVDYLSWDQRCPSCHRKKEEKEDPETTISCYSAFHLDPLQAVLDIFNENTII